MIEDHDLHVRLRDALAPEAPAELDLDLWPRMRERMAAPAPAPSLLDWALLAVLAGAAVAFPQVMLGVLYHF